MVINKIKKTIVGSRIVLNLFDEWHDRDVISLCPSKHLWFLTTFVLSATKIVITNMIARHSLKVKSIILVLLTNYHAFW